MNFTEATELSKNFIKRCIRWYKRVLLKDKFLIEAKRWFEANGDEKLRLNYPDLNESSVVVDLGGYIGDFAYDVHKKYGCKVLVFEPHPKFFNLCAERFASNNDIHVFNYGIGSVNEFVKLYDNKFGSSVFHNPFYGNKSSYECEIREFFAVLKYLKVNKINLLKINIEGGEYPLLNHIVNNNAKIVENYQIQFHDFIADAENKRNKIIQSLNDTHVQTWCYKFVWENWQLKN